MQSIVEGFNVVFVVVVGVAYCQTARCDFWGKEVDNFNEAVQWCDLLVPALGLPEVRVLSQMCGPFPSLLHLQTPAASYPSVLRFILLCACTMKHYFKG